MTVTAPARDVFAGTPVAVHNRTTKAVTIAGWCWHRGLTAHDVDTWDPATRRRAARAAGVNPPHDGSPTWTVVAEGLTRWWLEGHDVGREHLAERDAWAAVAQLDPVDDEPPPPDDEPGLPATWPRGWPARAKVYPVLDVDCYECGAPAITHTPDGPRCSWHPPRRPGDWGLTLDWSPAVCLLPLRCYCGRHP